MSILSKIKNAVGTAAHDVAMGAGLVGDAIIPGNQSNWHPTNPSIGYSGPPMTMQRARGVVNMVNQATGFQHNIPGAQLGDPRINPGIDQINSATNMNQMLDNSDDIVLPRVSPTQIDQPLYQLAPPGSARGIAPLQMIPHPFPNSSLDWQRKNHLQEI